MLEADLQIMIRSDIEEIQTYKIDWKTFVDNTGIHWWFQNLSCEDIQKYLTPPSEPEVQPICFVCDKDIRSIKRQVLFALQNKKLCEKGDLCECANPYIQD